MFEVILTGSLISHDEANYERDYLNHCIDCMFGPQTEPTPCPPHLHQRDPSHPGSRSRVYSLAPRAPRLLARQTAALLDPLLRAEVEIYTWLHTLLA